MIIGIEGTGSQGWSSTDLDRSFVRKVLTQSAQKHKFYFIGPNNPGTDGADIVRGAWFKILELGVDDPVIHMVGYSRGAAYCMKLAEKIQSHWNGERKVDFLAMFDAVGRNTYSTNIVAGTAASTFGRQEEVDCPDKVPSSVRICYHAVRSPSAGSRAGFGNVGLDVMAKGKTSLNLKQDFFCSHGAMGGTSYNAKEDEGSGHALSWVLDSNRALNATMPADPRYKNAPKFPVTDDTTDYVGMQQVGRWMWKLMVNAGMLPKGSDHNASIKTFDGSKTPGIANVVK